MNKNYTPPDDYSRLYGNSTSTQNQSYPQNAELKRNYPSPAPVMHSPKPQKFKQPFSPISLLLVAGVIFLFLGGVIFLTNTWDMLSDAVRAMSLLSASLIAFGASLLADRIFRLQKTGLAFYILGCIFLPLAIAGIGAFQLFGTWFSFDGDGEALLWTTIFLSISVSTFFGQKLDQNLILIWISLSGTFGTWTSFCYFIMNELPDSISDAAAVSIFSILLITYAVVSAIMSERYLRNHENTYIAKAIPSYLYIVNMITAIFMLIFSHDYKVTAGICSFILTLLFCNYRFIKNKLHTGVFGSALCLLTALHQMTRLFPYDQIPLPLSYEPYIKEDSCFFIWMLCAVIFMSLYRMPKLRTEFTETYSKAGMILGSIMTVPLTFVIAGDETILLILYPLLFMGVIFYSRSEKNPLSKETKLFIIHSCMLFATSMRTIQTENTSSVRTNLLLTGFVLSALILLIQALIRRKIWMLTLAVLISGSVISCNLKHSALILLWLCTAGMLGGIIYANRKWRFNLERCCAWGFLAFLTTAFHETLVLWMESDVAWIMTLMITGLLYLIETFVFWRDLRPNATKPYLEMESLFLSVIAVFSYLDHDTSKGFGLVLCILMLIFAGGFLRRDANAIAIPQLVMIFLVVSNLIDEASSVTVQVILYMLLLIIYAVMGRILLPNFYHNEGQKTQTDWALLAGILPVFGAAATIDWYPSILVCLFLAIYSLLYIGRVQNRFIPTLMASAFSCLTIFFHNVNDPFEIFAALHDSEMKTPQVLLYVLPFHIFILSLLWILPEKYKASVHKARFMMYCFTMFCLLIVSLNFKNASDAILLMGFSFAILVGSFHVKKLRWFTLGFSVLFLTTLRLTWKFWTSLHWGIYLFLAGIILIGVASYTEYQNRYYLEHPDEPKKKLDFFKTWIW